jgi:ubiquinone biosynthesis protein
VSSTLASLMRLPKYARNVSQLLRISRVLGKHGFGHLLVRLGLTGRDGLFSWMVSTAVEDVPSDASWEVRVRMSLEALGPTFVKLGQMAATRPDLIPMSLVFELRKLQDDVPGFSFEQVREMIQSEFGQPLEELYGSFDATPLAAASIAQVHRATLTTGEQVVAKVQRPGLEQVIRNDLEVLRFLAAMLEDKIPETRRFRPVEAVDQFARGLLRETDFSNEVGNLERFRRNFADDPNLHVPEVHHQLSSKRVITMEFIDGCKVTNKAQMRDWQVSGESIARNGTHIVIRSIFDHGFFHADPHPGNFFVLRDGRIALIDFGMMGVVDRETMDELLSFLVAILMGDAEMLVTQFIELGLVDDTVDVRAMQADISGIISRYQGLTLARLDIGQFITEVFEAVVRYRVRLPVELILMGKAISTMEGVAQEVHPDFDPLAEVRPYLVQLYARRVLDPRAHSRKIGRILNDYTGLLRVLPGDLRGVLRRLKAGELTLRHLDGNADQRAVQLERHVNRTLVAVWCLACWALFPSAVEHAGPRWGLLWWYAVFIGLQGLVSGTLFGLALLRSRIL